MNYLNVLIFVMCLEQSFSYESVMSFFNKGKKELWMGKRLHLN